MKEPISIHVEKSMQLKGIGPKTEKVIRELLGTGDSEMYWNLSTDGGDDRDP